MGNATTDRRGAARRTGVLLSLLLLALVAARADASVLERLSLEGLRQRADAIVLGRVVSSVGIWSQRGIETETVVTIERSWRGPTGGELRLRSAGGTVPDYRMVVRGAPSFSAGERVVLFLFRDGGDWRPVGMFQGVWRLPAGDRSTESRATLAWPSPTAGARLVDLGPGPYAVDGGPRTLGELVGEAAGGGR